jgi:nicotinate phosphoribosyltransferase
MDIVEVDGKPLAKRGKWSGSKRVLVCARCGERKIVPNKGGEENSCSCGGVVNDVLVPALDNGKPLIAQTTPSGIREAVLQSVKDLPLQQ